MVVVMCWLIIHTSNDKLDNRHYNAFKGVIMKEAGDSLLVNFYDDFKTKKIDTKFNSPSQLVSENECSYE